MEPLYSQGEIRWAIGVFEMSADKAITVASVKTQYNVLSQKYHLCAADPQNKNGEKSTEICRAYEVLLSYAQRADGDKNQEMADECVRRDTEEVERALQEAKQGLLEYLAAQKDSLNKDVYNEKQIVLLTDIISDAQKTAGNMDTADAVHSLFESVMKSINSIPTKEKTDQKKHVRKKVTWIAVSVCVLLSLAVVVCWKGINHVIKGHNFVVDQAVQATCTAGGYTKGEHCSYCGYIRTNQTYVAATGHYYSSLYTEKETTCTTSGVEIRQCSRCGMTQNVILPAEGHQCVTEAGVEPTCTTPGTTMRIYCNVCGTVVVESSEVSAFGHFEATIPSVQPTCEFSGGTEGRYCIVCGTTTSPIHEIAPTGHTAVPDAAIAATCAQPGLTEGSHCAVCEKILTEQAIIPVIEHQLVEMVAVAPTCTMQGMTAGVSCSSCGKVIQAQTVVPALGHVPMIDSAKAPTCTVAGLAEGSHCSVCGKVIVAQKSVPANGHSLVEQQRTEPTRTADGAARRICSVCGYEQTEIIPATGSTKLSYKLNSDGQSYSVAGIGLCRDTDVYIPAKYCSSPVANVGKNAFKENKTLRSITIPGSVKSIGDYAFDSCNNLNTVVILDGVKSIGANAFSNCPLLTKVTISGSVTIIGENAFRNCTGLMEISFLGTMAQWDSIEKGNNWRKNTSRDSFSVIFIIHCTDGDKLL